MRARRKEQHDQPARESPRPPFGFAQDRLHYASQKTTAAATATVGIASWPHCSFLGWGPALFVMLVAYWLTGQL